MYNHCISLKIIIFNISKVESFYKLFLNCYHIISLNLSSFGTSQASQIDRMFENSFNLKLLNLSNFYPLNITFYGI